MAQLWLLYPPPPLNYNLTMARDHRVLHYLFWKYPLPSFSRSRPSQGLLGTLPCSQEARGDFVTQPWILIWLLQNELAFCGLTCIETIHLLIQTAEPQQGCGTWPISRMSCTTLLKLLQRPEAYVFCFLFFDLFSGTWNRIFMSPQQALIYFISFPFPLAAPFPPYSSSMSSQGSFLSKENWLCLKAVIKNVCLWSLLQKFCRTNAD